MSDGQSVTHWLDLLKRGDEHAAQNLWERYYAALVRMARRRIAGSSRRVSDEEDVAISTFDSLCRGAAEGRFPQLDDRDDLWKLLVVMTARKATAHKKHAARLKRGGGTVRGDSVFIPLDDDGGAGIAQVVGDSPTPEFAAQVAEECERRLTALDSDLRQLAQWKLEGYSNEEIADRLHCVPRTVERKLQRIRAKWETKD